MQTDAETFQHEGLSLASIARHNSGRAGIVKRRACSGLAKSLRQDGWPITALAELFEVSRPAIRRWLERDEARDEQPTQVLTPLRTRSDLTQAKLREVLTYNPATGIFIWAEGRPRSGKVAGWVNVHGYRVISISKVEFLAHHLAWLYVYGRLPAQEIDHRNGDRCDNRIDNLRDVTRVTNTQNQRRRRSGAAPNLPFGTTYDKARQKYAAYIGVDGKTIALGRFPTPEEAEAAYLAAKRLLHSGCTI